MSDDRVASRLAALLRTLKPKTKEPVSTKVLNNWIAQAEGALGDEAKGYEIPRAAPTELVEIRGSVGRAGRRRGRDAVRRQGSRRVVRVGGFRR